MSSALQIIDPAKLQNWRRKDSPIWVHQTEQMAEELAFRVLRTLFDQPPWLEASYLYDEAGSDMFDQITQLPEYYVTRTENAILRDAASAVIESSQVEFIVEVGAGLTKKTRHLLREQASKRGGGTFVPIDVSLAALQGSYQLFQAEFPELTFQGLNARYEAALPELNGSMPKLLVFLGNTIGNLSRRECLSFLEQIGGCMGRGDRLLLGVDRTKGIDVLQPAYDDPQGVTKRFILNIFSHVNRLTGSNFDIARMRYLAQYDQQRQQMEMSAVSTCRQEIRFPAAGLSLVWEEGDRILVEISRKFDPDQLIKMLRLFDLKIIRHFSDDQKLFSVLLMERSSRENKDIRLD